MIPDLWRKNDKSEFLVSAGFHATAVPALHWRPRAVRCVQFVSIGETLGCRPPTPVLPRD